MNTSRKGFDHESSLDKSHHGTCIANRFCNLQVVPVFVGKTVVFPDTTLLCSSVRIRGLLWKNIAVQRQI